MRRKNKSDWCLEAPASVDEDAVKKPRDVVRCERCGRTIQVTRDDGWPMMPPHRVKPTQRGKRKRR